MKLKLLVAGMGLLVGAAGPDKGLPLPPTPPEHLALGDDAPVPDVNVAVPQVAQPQRPTVSVEMYRATGFDASRGFTPGSRFQTAEDRKPIQTPGLSVRIPLQ